VASTGSGETRAAEVVPEPDRGSHGTPVLAVTVATGILAFASVFSWSRLAVFRR
jgi:hypothetical protein